MSRIYSERINITEPGELSGREIGEGISTFLKYVKYPVLETESQAENH